MEDLGDSFRGLTRISVMLPINSQGAMVQGLDPGLLVGQYPVEQGGLERWNMRGTLGDVKEAIRTLSLCQL